MKCSYNLEEYELSVVIIPGDKTMMAYLYNNEKYSIFQVNKLRIKFKTSPYLQEYTEIKKWNKGYIECMAKYSTLAEPVEEYIDLRCIAERLELPDGIFDDVEGVVIGERRTDS